MRRGAEKSQRWSLCSSSAPSIQRTPDHGFRQDALICLAQCGNDLAQGDAAVVGGDALVPIGAEAFFPQASDGALGQVTVLEAAAGQDDARLAECFATATMASARALWKRAEMRGTGTRLSRSERMDSIMGDQSRREWSVKRDA